MQYFFSTDISKDKIFLSKDESKHCALVLRHELGDIIYVVDGKGNEFKCKILAMNKATTELEILNQRRNLRENDYYIHIVISPTKSNQRLEWFVEKAIEIGIDEISFICCAHSERKKINIDRINKVALSAMKQSLKTYLPKINNIQKYSEVVKSIKQKNKYIGYLGGESKQFLSHILPKKDNYCLFIGPEGDFSDDEVELAIDNSFTPVLLSNSRLRTETAGLVGCMVLNEVNHDK